MRVRPPIATDLAIGSEPVSATRFAVRPVAGGALAVGAAVGAAYTLSPLTMLFFLAAALAVSWATRGLTGSERRWVARALALAIALRVTAVAVLLLLTNPEGGQYNAFFPDARFVLDRSLWMVNLRHGVTIGPWYLSRTFEHYGDPTYSYALSLLQEFVGPSPYALNFLSVGAFIAGSIILHKLVRVSFGAVAALGGFVLLLFWPTSFAWSVSLLKESLQLALTAIALAGAVAGLRANTWRRRAGGIVAAAAALAIDASLRSAAAIILCLSIGVNLALLLVRTSRVAGVLMLGTIAVCVLTPQVRRTAVERTTAEVRGAASRHLGNVVMPGYSYRPLDDRFYAEGQYSPATMVAGEGARFLIRAAVDVLVVPTPWQIWSRSALLFLPQQLVWYVLVVLAVPGILVGFQRDVMLTLLLATYIASGIALIGPNNGNIGTLVRHRDMVVPFVGWFGALGACWTLSRISASPSWSASS